MAKEEALEMIDRHKNALVDPVAMLNWTWLRVVIAHISEEEWNEFLERSMPVLGR